MKPGRVALVLLLAVATPGDDAVSESGGAEPDALEQLVLARFLARPDESHRRFRVRRRMRAEGLGKRAFMDVRVEMDPEDGFRFQVEAEGGSRLLLDRALRVGLAKEREAHASADPAQRALTSENYVFGSPESEGDGYVRLRALPRRPETTLLDGSVLVTADSADLVRVDGRLARAPSFWIPRVDVARQFRRIQGHRVQVRLESVAHLRLLGEVCLVVDSDYEMVDGEDITAPDVRSSAEARDASPGSAETPGCRLLHSRVRAVP